MSCSLPDRSDRTGVEAWIAARRDDVYRTAWRILRDDSDAEDATQDAFVDAARRWEALARADDPERYLRRMAVNAALGLLRRARSRRERDRRRTMMTTGGREVGRDERVEREDERRAVARALAGLPEELRVPLTLRYAEDLTLAEIGEALGYSAPTALARVRRGEERLREALARSGLGAVAGALPLEGLLRDLETPAPSPAFAGRAAEAVAKALAEVPTAPRSPAPSPRRALALGRRSAAFLVGGAVAAAAVVAFAALPWGDSGGRSPAMRDAADREGAGSLGASDPNPAPRGHLTSEAMLGYSLGDTGKFLAESRAGTERGPEGGAALGPRPGPADRDRGGDSPTGPAAAPELATGWIEGTIVGERGDPLDGAAVRAESVVRAGKGPRHERRARTGTDGRFRVEVPVERDAGEPYSVYAGTDGYGSAGLSGLVVRAGRPADPPGPLEPGLPPGEVRLVLKRLADPGSFVVTGTVLDDEGRPVAGALVGLHRVVDDLAHGGNVWPPRESLARTDDAGRFAIEGTAVGEKLLRVEGGPSLAAVPHEEPLTIRDGERLERIVVLSRGLEVSGRVVDLGGNPVAGGRLELWRAEDELHSPHVGSAGIAADGTFRFVALAPGDYDIVGIEHPAFARSGPPAFARFRLRSVAAGTTGVEIVVKPWDDESDRGVHGAEIHGEVVSTDGRPLRVAPECVQLVPVDGAEEDVLDDLVAALFFPEPAQCMAVLVEEDAPPPAARFHLTGLEPGTYLVWVEPEPRYLASTGLAGGVRDHGFFDADGRPAAGAGRGFAGPFTVREGEVRTGLRVEMATLVTVEGVVVEAATGAPIAGAIVSVESAGAGSDLSIARKDAHIQETGGRGTIPFGYEARTGSDGRFAIASIPAGVPLRVAAFAPDRRPAVSAPFSAAPGGAPADLKLALEERP